MQSIFLLVRNFIVNIYRDTLDEHTLIVRKRKMSNEIEHKMLLLITEEQQI